MDKIKTVSLDSPLYPASLKRIQHPPKVLYARGNLDLLKGPPGGAIVGTRNASPNGRIIAKRVTEYIVSQTATVVSGLASGIDAAAHESCLAAGGKTIAVLAHGLHMVYPQCNAALAQRILEAGGLWVSEHAPGVAVNKDFFVPRNRIQVGLSACSIVVEASEKSGTTTHARFCVQEKHPLYAVIPVSGNPLKLNSTGSQMMVEKMGAIPLRSRDDYEKITLKEA